LGNECRPPAAIQEEIVQTAGAAKRAGAEAGQALVLVDVAVKGKNTLALAQEFLGIFHEQLREGAICRERTRRML